MNADLTERSRRWRLAFGDQETTLGGGASSLSERDQRLDRALTALYGSGEGKKGRGGLGDSAPRVARWLGDVREFFPAPVVQVIQRDAFERLSEAGRTFDMLVFPRVRHGIRTSRFRLVFHRRKWEFLQRELIGRPAP